VATGDDLEWDDLRYFLCAAQAGTLAGAARALGVQHTTVGRRLTALEHTLGAPLFFRRPDGLALAPLGERLVPMAEQVERAIMALRDQAAAQRSRVRLAMPSGTTALFTAALPRLRAAHPEITLELMSGSRPVDLSKGEADLALRLGPVTAPDLVIRKLCESGWSLYASEAYLARRPPPASVDDLRGHDLIAYDASLAHMPAAKWIEERARGATIALRSREMSDMVAAAVSGAGLAAISCMLADAEPSLRRVTPEVLGSRTLALVYRREARPSAALRAVIEFVAEVIDEHEERLSGRPRAAVARDGS
jgi:DNA-binding transcriptional LysR family regulator